MTQRLRDLFNLPFLTALAAHRPPRKAPLTGTQIRLDLGGQPVLVDRCEDGVLRVPRRVVELLVGLQEDELAELMPALLSQHEVRLLSITVDYGPSTASASLLLTALADEMKRVQPLVNLSSTEIRQAVEQGGPEVVLRPTPRGTP